VLPAGALAAAPGRRRASRAPIERWLADVTSFGTAAERRDGGEARFEAGGRTPIRVPASASGNPLKALEEWFAAFA
jgi:hypothetical protein